MSLLHIVSNIFFSLENSLLYRVFSFIYLIFNLLYITLQSPVAAVKLNSDTWLVGTVLWLLLFLYQQNATQNM